MEIVHVFYNVLCAGVRYLVIIKSTKDIPFFQRTRLILLLKWNYSKPKFSFNKCRIDAKRIPGNAVYALKTDVLRVERLLCKIHSKLLPIVFYVILIIFEDDVPHFNENNEVSSRKQLHTNSYDTVKGWKEFIIVCYYRDMQPRFQIHFMIFMNCLILFSENIYLQYLYIN